MVSDIEQIMSDLKLYAMDLWKEHYELYLALL